MSNDLNNCQFIGRLGRDPEVKYMANGAAVANFTLAVGSQWKNKAGEKQESTEWVNVTAYAKLGEICGEYLRKGSQVYIGGKMETRKWQDKEGKDRYTTEIIAGDMQMLGGKPEGQERQAAPQRAAPAAKPAANIADDFDDLPF